MTTIAQILALQDVDRAGSDQKFYFNCGSVGTIEALQSELRANNVSPIIVCRAAETDPNFVYYTPKFAKMGASGSWIAAAN